MRSPAILAGPGVAAGTRVEALAYLFDLTATVGDLCGANPRESPLVSRLGLSSRGRETPGADCFRPTSADTVRLAVAERSMFQLFDMAEALKIDIYPREMIPGELGRSALLEVFEGMSLPEVSKPDAAGSKLVWASKGSHKSRLDLRQIVRRLSASERAELDRLAGVLGLGNLLAVILAEPDEIAG